MSTLLRFETIRKRIEEGMAAAMEEVQVSIAEVTNGQFINESAQYVARLATDGGKRLRGYAVYEMYLAAGGKDEEGILQVAVAFELFHLFLLIQDDVMDRSSHRRGFPTVHTFTQQWLEGEQRQGDLAHVAESQAILWGDYLMAVAQELLVSSGLPNERLAEGFNLFSRLFREVVIGQMIDVDLTTRVQADWQDIETKNLLKTALYSFVRPMQLGVILATEKNELLLFCEEFGRHVGTAFQIQDDLFDVILTEAELGKPVLQDIKAGQQTFFTNYIFEHGTKREQKELVTYWGRLLEADEEKKVRALFLKSEAVEQGKAEILRRYSAAKDMVSGLEAGKESKTGLEALVELLIHRQK